MENELLKRIMGTALFFSGFNILLGLGFSISGTLGLISLAIVLICMGLLVLSAI